MINRFLAEKDNIKKACIDLDMLFSFTEDEIKYLQIIDAIIGKASETVKILSSNDANINTADLAISQCILSIYKIDHYIAKNFVECLKNRYCERRIELAEILAFFLSRKVDQSQNLFYKMPSKQNIANYSKMFGIETSALYHK